MSLTGCGKSLIAMSQEWQIVKFPPWTGAMAATLDFCCRGARTRVSSWNLISMLSDAGLRQNDAASRGEDWRRAHCERCGFAHACPRGEIQGRNPRYALQIHSHHSKIQGGLAISSDGAAVATGVPDEQGGA